MALGNRLVPYNEYMKPVDQSWRSNKWNDWDIKAKKNSRSLLEQKTFCGDIFIVDKKSPRELREDNSFSLPMKFFKFNKMVDGNFIIALLTKEGAVKRLKNRKDTYYLYQVLRSKIRWVSLLRNIIENEDNTRHAIVRNPRFVGEVDWEAETGGAIYFDEVHVDLETVMRQARDIKCLGSNKDPKIQHEITQLKKGIWVYYVCIRHPNKIFLISILSCLRLKLATHALRPSS